MRVSSSNGRTGGVGRTLAGRLAALALVVAAGGEALASHSTPVYNPVTNRYYAYVTAGPGGILWVDANAQAHTHKRDNVPAYLVTIGSAQENTFLVENLLQFGRPNFPNGYPIAAADMYWLGGYQPPGSPEPAGGWTWVTGEPWGYTAWEPLAPEPNDNRGEERLAFWRTNYEDPYTPWIPNQPPIGVWNDEPSWYTGLGYVIEWQVPVPFASAAPTDYAYLIGTRADPGAGATAPIQMRGLDVRAGSSFTLGENEALTLTGVGTPLGPLTIGTGAHFTAHGPVSAAISSSGLFTIPAARMLLANATLGGVVRVVPPGQSVLIEPPGSPRVNEQTFVQIGGSGFSGTNGGAAGPGRDPGQYLLDTGLVTNQGVLAWDGALNLTGNYSQEAEATMRAFVAGPTEGDTHTVLGVNGNASVDGVLEVVLEPELFNYVPNVGDSFVLVRSGNPITLSPTLQVRTYMTSAGAASLGITLAPHSSGFASDPNALVAFPSNLFTHQLTNGGTELRVTLAQPICVPITGPSSVAVCSNQGAAMSVVSRGSGPTTYAWRLDGVALNPGANPSAATANLLLPPGAAPGVYDCVVTSPCGSVASGAATLSVTAGPTVSAPQAVAACAGGAANFSVTPGGAGPFTYQWRKGGVAIGGATGATLNLASVGAADAGSYDCVVTNSCGSVTSAAAALTVGTAPVASAPSAVVACVGTPASFSVSASGTGPFTYQWRKDGGVISGATAASYAIASVGAADAGAYDCVVTNSCGSGVSASAALTVQLAPTASAPTSATACEGSPASFSVTAGGTGPFTYQWRKDGSPIGGATGASYPIATVAAADAGAYDCVVTGACGSVTSGAGTLTVSTAPTASAPAPASACEGSAASFSVTAGGTAPFTYQWRKGGVAIGGATGATYSIAAVAVGDAEAYDCVVTNSCGSVTSAAAALVVDVAPSIGGPSAVTACVGTPASFSVSASGTSPLTYQWRRNAVEIAGATGASLSIASVAEADAGVYDCVVANACGSSTSAGASLTVNTSPTASAPTNASVCEGAAASFSVVAGGTGPFTYQWRKDGGAIDGAVGASYSIAAASTADAGTYDCVVTGACGSVTSAAGTLGVNVGPSVATQPTNLNAFAGSNATLSVVAAGTGPIAYQWRKDGANLVDGATITGSTTASLAIEPILEEDAGVYDVVLTNECGTVTSQPATVAVTICPADLANGAGEAEPDGGVDINDLIFFLGAFQDGSEAADLDNDGDPTSGNADGGVDVSDLLFFLARFELGC